MVQYPNGTILFTLKCLIQCGIFQVDKEPPIDFTCSRLNWLQGRVKHQMPVVPTSFLSIFKLSNILTASAHAFVSMHMFMCLIMSKSCKASFQIYVHLMSIYVTFFMSIHIFLSQVMLHHVKSRIAFTFMSNTIPLFFILCHVRSCLHYCISIDEYILQIYFYILLSLFSNYMLINILVIFYRIFREKKLH